MGKSSDGQRRCERSRRCVRAGSWSPCPGRPAPRRVAEAAQAAEVRAPPFPVEPDGAGLATIAYLLANGAVEAEAAEVFDLEEVAKAREAGRAGQAGHARGKIVLRVRH